MRAIIRTLSMIALALVLSGCKLAVMVSSHGSVLSASGTRNCTGPDYCEFIISDADFSETFTAVPQPGFTFVEWQSGNGFICADSTDPVCVVEMPDSTVGALIVALFKTGSIRPVFSDPGGVDTDGDGMINDVDFDDDNDGVDDSNDNCPLEGPDIDGSGCPLLAPDDMVRLNDKFWAQPELFVNVDWYAVYDVCNGPDGLCAGKIAGIDVTGWSWASGDDVTDILNAFFGTALGPIPDFVSLPSMTLSPNIFEYFRSNGGCCETVRLAGWIREEVNIVEGYIYGASCNDLLGNDCESPSLGGGSEGPYGLPPKFFVSESVGVWLHRPAP